MDDSQCVDTILLKVSVLNARLLLLSATADARSSMRCRSDSDLSDDWFLTPLWYKARQFDFVERVSNGDTLLVGEGNLSFSLSLSRKRQIHPRKLIATTFEAEKYLSRETRNNASRLRSGGTTVLHGVDARNLSATIKSARFDNIVFMFPNVASRTPNRGRNPNHRLICRFLMSAALHLKAGAKIIISAVHSPHYLGAFGFEEAAKKTGYQPPDVYRFDPSDFPRYEHVMTHQEENALRNHKKFSLWVFRLK